jgi:hypothetical protein
MPDPSLKPGIRTALRLNEIGDASPYRLSFAGKGKSGASFGFMQGDMAAGQPEVLKAFRDALAAAGSPSGTVEGLVKRLSVHLVGNPLSAAETKAVNDALLAGRAVVDAMDETILGKVYADLDTCIAKASGAGRSIAPKAALYMALWINMTGHPTKLLVWLAGGDPGLRVHVPPPPATVDGPAIEAYLRATDYFSENPGNFPHMMQSVAAGVTALG